MSLHSQSPSVQNIFTNLLNSKTPPKEFFNFTKTSIPQSIDLAKKRICYNLEKFKTFYCCIALGFSFIFILFKPSVVLLIGLGVLCTYGNIHTPTVNGFKFTRMYTNSLTTSLVLLYIIFFNNVIVSVLALICLLTLGILTHAVTIEEDEVQEDV